MMVRMENGHPSGRLSGTSAMRVSAEVDCLCDLVRHPDKHGSVLMDTIQELCPPFQIKEGRRGINLGLSGSLNAILTNNYYELDADSRKSICVRMGTIKLVGAQIDFSAGLKFDGLVKSHFARHSRESGSL